MQIFLSYAAEDRALAEEVQLALIGAGNRVFFDRDSLPPGGDYHARIQAGVRDADAFLFLITPSSIAAGSYALTELKHARTKWPHPKGRLIPVLARPVEWNAVPPYLRSVTVLEPEGNMAAEVVGAIESLRRSPPEDPGRRWQRLGAGRAIVLAGVGSLLLVALAYGVVLIVDLDAPPIVAEGMTGADPGIGTSPSLNVGCPEITFTDYSKFPPESRIERRCEP